ncbi:MAG: hypothetical protein DMF00_08710 [Verrucomicrobia bacterium]|nr:MAG: hypothetical protein DMF00_08710 [Verrucomicrobiota bacterium]
MHIGAFRAFSYPPRNLRMHSRLIFPFIFGALIASVAFGQDKSQPTVDELVSKNIEAKGGATALRDLQSLRLTGKLLVQQGGEIELGYLEIKKRPDEVRTEASLQGMTQIQAYDGKEGWKVSPFFGRKDPERMSADDVKALIEDSEIDGALVDWKAKGSTVEYLGTEDVDGTPAHKLKVVRKNGDVSFVFLDPDHFLEIRVLTQRMRHGAHEEVETDLGDYEKAGGVFVPTSIEAGRKGAPDKQRVIIDKIEANVAVDDAKFHFPGQIALPQPKS